MLDLTKHVILSLSFHHICRINLYIKLLSGSQRCNRNSWIENFKSYFSSPCLYVFLYVSLQPFLHINVGINPYGKVCFLLSTELSCFVCKPDSSTFNQQWNANNSCRSNGLQSTPVLAISSVLLYSSH